MEAPKAVHPNGAKPPPPTPPPPTRMGLGSLVKGRQSHPTRVLLYGPEGVGKTTFGANAPSPIFLGAEEGSAQLDVVRFPQPETWAECLEAVSTLTTEKHEFKSLIIDTADWMEPLIWDHVCRRDSVGRKDALANIEAYGYGKGYQVAVDEWRILLSALERLRKAQPMHVIVLAHSWIKPFKNPTGEDYDRFELKVHKQAAGLLKEWCDAVLFATHETYAVKDDRKRVRGIDNNGARIVYTQRRAAYDAKNRYSLPDTMPLDWAEFAKAVEAHQPAEPDALIEAIMERALKLGGKDEEDTKRALVKVGRDAVKLAQLANWTAAKLQEKETN